ncbi:MAG: SURF1 family protein [Longimicrobiales bacterium]
MSSTPADRGPARATIRVSLAGLAGTLLVLVVAVVCVRLGLWQLDRLEQRRARNSVIARQISAPPLELRAAPPDTAGLIFRRVRLTGEPDRSRTVAIAGRSFGGSPGIHVLTPYRLGAGGVLVNRGWVPAVDPAAVDLDRFRVASPHTVTGIVLPLNARGAARPDTATAARVWYGYDAAIAARLPYRAPPLYVQELGPQTRGARLGYPRPLPLPDLTEGPHLGYAIQWFSFAVIALVGWSILAIRGSAAQRNERGAAMRK